MERPLTVGQLAHATASEQNHRYYEQVGVLRVPRRSGAGTGTLPHDVHRLLFIRRRVP